MFKTVIFKAALVAAFVLVGATSARASDRIVAVVNDQVITLAQLNARTALNMRQLGLNDDSQKAAVSKRTLSGLVDEELQRQYATQANIKLQPADIAKVKERAVQGVGGQANWDSLVKGYEASANDKLAAEALWDRIMARDVQPRVQVSTAEADRLIGELAKSRHVLNREISIIQLNPGEGDGDKAQLDKLSELKEKLAKGDKFDELARAYSDDKSAVSGGKLGWFAGGELNPQLEEALDKMQPGNISEPIRTPMGWYLVKLDNVRTTKPVETGPQTQVELYFLAAAKPTDEKELKDLKSRLAKAVSNMKDAKAVRDYFGKGDYATKFDASKALGWVVVDDLDPELVKGLNGVKPGRWSDEIIVNDTVARVFVGDSRQTMPDKLNGYRQKVMDNIYGNRVELEARRFMQNLRQRAFLDVRL